MSVVGVWKAWAGRTVGGKLPLQQWLGGSDHSAVFLTERQGQPHRAAIKLIAAEDSAEAEHQLARWRAAAQLSHPHLIRIFEAGRSQIDGASFLYVVMEYAEEDLAQILPQRPLAPAEVTDMLSPVLDALSYLHGKGLVHGRIKPSNVLAVGDQLKLSADQIVSAAAPNSKGRRRDVYDAPETAAGIVSPAGDLWSVGATLVAALTQNVPLVADDSQGNPGLTAALPEPFRGIARECMHLDPKRRCSIAEIKARMQPAARSVPAEPEVAPPSPHSIRRGVVWAATLLAIAAGFVTIWKVASGPSGASNKPVTQTASAEAPTSTPVPAPAAPPPFHEPAAAPKKTAASNGGVVRQVLPDIPQSAKNTISGTIKITVRVEVDPSGKVTAAKLTSPGPSKYFANLVLRAAQQWEFSPSDVGGQPAASAWQLHFRLRKSSIQVEPQPAKR